MNQNTVFIYENAIGRLTFQYDSQLWITDVEGMSSIEIDIAESRSTMQIGSSITSQNVRPRSFTMDGAIFEPITAARERVLNIIAPQVPATLTIQQGGESWYLDVVPEKTPEITPGNGVQFFQIRLRAAYPYWRTTASYVSQIPGKVSLFKLPFNTGGSWWISRYGDDYFTTIENKGNVPVEFRVTFMARASLSNPELLHVNTGKRILIRKTLTAGEMFSVSTVYGQKGVVYTAASGEVSNGFRYLSMDSDLSMSLQPGSNTLQVNAAGRQGLGVRIEAPQGVKSGV